MRGRVGHHRRNKMLFHEEWKWHHVLAPATGVVEGGVDTEEGNGWWRSRKFENQEWTVLLVIYLCILLKQMLVGELEQAVKTCTETQRTWSLHSGDSYNH